jgi:hypothetical protein
MSTYSHLLVEMLGDVALVRLRTSRLEVDEIEAFGEELATLAGEVGRVILVLGPEPPDCLYSLFLAKLIRVRNVARRAGGELVLCELNDFTFSVFQACALDRAFVFRDSVDQAVAYFTPASIAQSAGS